MAVLFSLGGISEAVVVPYEVWLFDGCKLVGGCAVSVLGLSVAKVEMITKTVRIVATVFSCILYPSAVVDSWPPKVSRPVPNEDR